MGACVVWHEWTSFQEGCLAIYFESGYYGWKCPWNSRHTSVTHYHVQACHLCIGKTCTRMHMHTKIHPTPKCYFLSSLSAWMSVRELVTLCVHATEENRLLSTIIYTFLSSADINVSNPVVVMPSPHFLPNLHCALAQLRVLVSVKFLVLATLFTTLSFGIRCSRKYMTARSKCHILESLI